ncbi:MAG TPA: DNA translocase FtsK 4TM domain-containing protein, partial [Abditibacteriaceae bacterium]
MPKYSTPSLRDSSKGSSQDSADSLHEGILDLSDEMAGALDSSIDSEAASFVTPPTRRSPRALKNPSSNNSKKPSTGKGRTSQTEPTPRKRSGDSFSRRAARENKAWDSESEGQGTHNPGADSGMDVFPTAPWRKPHRAGNKSVEKSHDRETRESEREETVYRVNRTEHSRNNRARRSFFGHKREPVSTLIFEIVGILLMAAGAVLLFNALQPQAEGLLPRFGINALRFLFGLGAVVFPLLVGALGLLLIVQRQRTNFPAFFGGVGMAFPVFLTALHLQVPPGEELLQSHSHDFGGVIGAALALALRTLLGETGAIIALGALAIVALLVLTNLSLADTMGRAGRGVGRNARRVGSKTRRVWRRGVELAYEPTETSDPFARQLKQHDSPSHQHQVEPLVRQQPAPSLAPRRISNGV